MKTKVAVIAGVLGVAVMAYGNVANAEVTGCLTKLGRLARAQQGDTPTKACKSSQTEVSVPEVADVPAVEDVPVLTQVGVTGYEIIPFHVVANPADGDSTDVVIAATGTFTYLLRCSKDSLADDTAELIITSTDTSWHSDNNAIGLGAGAEVTADSIDTSGTGGSGTSVTEDAPGLSSAAMDSAGNVMVSPEDAGLLGLNIDGTNVCTATGVVHAWSKTP